ncbi:3D domain-containing protein [Paenibacillus sp. HWE-109]|uniref:3D domain-containing protein n=1 Tax=Paenibacillus sp. HWE-109 TaxID=1306526 RepID=UPI001EDDFC5F|nr:3D domain-containing protein [Paenibacillus sp. HWE-109]UKS27162.1 3D domain-containing protein [Paenibacillus sp. HWE-109]
MFRKICFMILTLPILFSFMQANSAYSYPIGDEDLGMPPTYSFASNPSSAEPSAEISQVFDPAPTPSPQQYQVNSGDTLYRIARNFNIDVSDLIAANQIGDPNHLTIGQNLSIPIVEGSSGLAAEQPKIIKKVINTTLTAYTAGFESTGKKASHPQYGITYSGKKAKEGRTIAVDPAVIPLGSTVFIEGIGIRKAEDIGSAIRGPRIDVFMNDLGEAQEFGVKKNVKVYLLDKENV